MVPCFYCFLGFHLRTVLNLILSLNRLTQNIIKVRGGSRTAATSKMERFVIIVNGWKLLTIITKLSMLDVAAVLDSFVAIKPHNFKIWSSLLHGFHTPQFQKNAVLPLAFLPHHFKILPTLHIEIF